MQSLQSRNSKYLLSVFDLSKWPNNVGNEAVFIGKSNVGKSSLLNLVLSKNNLAHTSKTPGRTKGINIFETEISKKGKEAKKPLLKYVVDLPGLGHAKMSKKEKEQISVIMTDYLNLERPNRLFFNLLDARREIGAEEIEFNHSLRQAGNVIVVLTKVDQIPNHKRKPLRINVANKLKIDSSNCVLSSEFLKLGKAELLEAMWNQSK